ncbi:MAG: LL-diaminopimelate aminotransferase [Candidatus Omnitrophica bacterium CG11_big_fil_rev_8_21_14_0_20_45_26]|uniref:Aminotransferase n=1 Tax=Candidatus Abzuiibacterium crystallinum TaxID=1974748 RepID=A0A2H0LMS8_9BACT|nr:MAG: LL-diaminopimelate aminotransferase [Candidatus Omnitrophica bacterium CG11_big_fil_rev_8_21_14_0_20_45_26]PIW65241.1 MAG: LL-diaminopimelate aminotransferase [Candidatus Omnitrophica bacterium CG12_big_fil_rev_8_21_14_0_65_45_16]
MGRIDSADRIKRLPPYLFAEVDRLKRELIQKGKDVIDLGVGDPDLPTPKFIIDALYEAAKDAKNHRYALDQGLPELRKGMARWYQNRFGVELNPDTEILPLIGSKEGIAHLPLALLNPGDISLVPDPCYPVYKSATWFAGGEVHLLDLLEENQYLPTFKDIPDRTLERAKLLFLNYPNNPTGACATPEFFKNTVSFAKEHQLIVCHDAAYTEIAFDHYKPLSFLQTPGAKSVGVEFHSLSKTYNMTGWRVGFVCGNHEVVRHLSKLKANIDSGIFQAIQIAGLKALEHGQAEVDRLKAIYQKRRDIVVNGFQEIGWQIQPPKATFYMWLPVPPGYTSQELCLKFLKEANVVVVPGNGFGSNGEGYFRISLTMAEDRLTEAVNRIKKIHTK